MALNFTLEDIKKGSGLQGNDFQNDTLQFWIDETVSYLKDAGVPESKITAGVVARGVFDLWDYGSGNGELSPYFMNRAIQLAIKG